MAAGLRRFASATVEARGPAMNSPVPRSPRPPSAARLSARYPSPALPSVGRRSAAIASANGARPRRPTLAGPGRRRRRRAVVRRTNAQTSWLRLAAGDPGPQDGRRPPSRRGPSRDAN
jgi:hypothetical protein